MFTFKAEFPGRCPWCRREIKRNDLLTHYQGEYSLKKTVCHLRCLAGMQKRAKDQKELAEDFAKLLLGGV